MRTPTHLAAIARQGHAGRHWYRVARRYVRRTSHTLSVPRARFAAILSLFSPRTTVGRSITKTLHYLRTSTFTPDTPISIRASVLHYERTGEIRGPKTRAFYLALLGDDSAVVLDVWMARALNLNHKRLGSNKHYHSLATRRILHTSTLLGWTPAETQAAIWHATLLAHNRNPLSATYP